MTLYFDHHATTPPSEAVIAATVAAMRIAGNASSSHEGGRRAKAVVEDARRCVAETLGDVDPNDVIFVGSASEGNTLALKGAVERWWMQRRVKPRVVVSAIEHSSVIAPARRMVERGMCDLDVIPVGPSGIVDVRDVANLLRPNTAIVSVQSCNNECGGIQPVEAIHALCRSANVIHHVDGAQDYGKITRRGAPWDVFIGSGHKIGAQVGIAFVHFAPHVFDRIEPQTLGGTQQRDMRGGTLPVSLCAGFAAACRAMRELCRGDGTVVGGLAGEPLRLAYMRDTLAKLLLDTVQDVRINGAMDNFVWENQSVDDASKRKRLYCNLNITIPAVCPIALGAELAPHVDVSAAAACKSLGGDRSHVLEAIGSPNDGADLRFGLGRCNTMEQVKMLAALIADAAARLRGVGCDVPTTCEGGVCPART